MTRQLCLPYPPANAGPGWPCDFPWFVEGISGGNPCPVWGSLFLPLVYAIEGGWLSGRVAASGSFNAVCSHVNACGATDPYVFWNIRNPLEGRGLKLHPWDALNAGLWTSSVSFTCYAYQTSSGSTVSSSPVQRSPCFPTSYSWNSPCFGAKTITASYSMAPFVSPSNFCTDNINPFSLTIYDDGTVSIP